MRALALVPACHGGVISAGATVPAERPAAGALWCLPRGAISAGTTVPSVSAGCSPLCATTVPRVPAERIDGKSLPSILTRELQMLLFEENQHRIRAAGFSEEHYAEVNMI